MKGRSQMSLWRLMASPLHATNDLRTMDEVTRGILMNAEVIAVDQDPLGRQAVRAIKDRAMDVWKKPLAGGHVALGRLNRGPETTELGLEWSDIALAPAWKVRDLWAERDVGVVRGRLTAEVGSHATRMFRLSPVAYQ